jgi:hypothetical protein
MRAAAAAAALLASALGAQDRASGSLTLNRVTTPLGYAYASPAPGFFDKTTEDIRLLFSDVPLPEAQRKDVFALIELGRTGRANIVEVVLNAGGAPIAGAIYSKTFNGMLSLTGMHRFDRARFDQTMVSGRMYTRQSGEFNGVTYDYSVDFAATIPRPPTAAEIASAIASPPGAAVTRYLAAIRRGELHAFLDTLTTAAASGYAGGAGTQRFAALRGEMPVDARVTRLEQVSPTMAKAVIEGNENGIVIEYEVLAELEEGAWKVAK